MPKNPTLLRIAVIRSGRLQKDIAAEAGISESKMSYIVDGKHADEATQRALAAVLGKSVEELFPAGVSQAEAA